MSSSEQQAGTAGRILRIGRENDALRDVSIDRNAVRYAEGSCLISFGGTRVLCAACLLYTSPSPRDS